MSGTIAGTLLESAVWIWQIRIVLTPFVIGAFVFLFGLVLGSFLNVCIVRIPSGKSVVLPASACPHCGTAIRPYDNIPVLSYLVLGGKCRGCKAPDFADVSGSRSARPGCFFLAATSRSD